MRARTVKNYRLFLLLLVAAGVIPFLYPWGDPMLSWRDVALPELPETDLSISLPSLEQHENGSAVTSQDVIIYRWRDESGSWHFSNTKPAEGIAFETMQVNTNSTPANEQQEGVTVYRSGTENPEEFNYSVEEISELISATRKVRTELEAHQQRLEEEVEKGH